MTVGELNKEVKSLLLRVAGDAPYPYPDNPNCIRVAIAYALGMATMVMAIEPEMAYAVLEYLANASDADILSITNHKPWEQN